jgi:exonuclease SbcC
MKIKRVEIQAFKSYLDKKDGTFDFTVNNGQTADIVSIYAPNGFGKTSFYDAIDFCMTNNITRFIRDQSLANANNTDAKGMNQLGQKQHILRANNAPENLASRVKITTESDEFERQVPVARSGSKDYSYDDKKTKPEERYFRSVMLSQEAIDGFLRELKPEIRYERFMAEQLGGDDTIEKNRQQIQSMLGGLNKRLEELQKKVDAINNKNLMFDLGVEPTIDSSSLIAINELAVELNEQGCDFTVFDEKFDDESSAKLLLQVAQLEEKVNLKITNIEAEKYQLDQLVDNFPLYEKNHREINELNEKITKLTKRISDIGLFQVLNEKHSVLSEQLDTRRASLEKLRAREKGLPDFVKQMKTKHEFSAQLKKLRNSLTNIEQEIKNNYAVSVELDSQKVTLRNKSEELETQKKDALKYFSKIKSIEEDIRQQNSTEPTARSIELDKNITNLKSEGVEVSSFRLEGLDEIVISKFSNDELLRMAREYSEKKLKQKVLNNNLAEMMTLLDRAKLQEDSVSTLIKLGSQLINHNQDQYCPLCQHEHESFTVLANAINSNSSLSDTQQRLLKDIEACQILIKQADEELRELSEGFSVHKADYLDSLRERLVILLNEQKSISNMLEKIVENNAEVNRLKQLTAQKTPEVFQLYIGEKIEKNIETTALLEAQINTIKGECIRLAEEEQKLKVDFASSISKSENDGEFLNDYLVFLTELRVSSEDIEPKINEQALKGVIVRQLKIAADLFDEKQQEVKENDEALSVLNAERTVSFFEKSVEGLEGLTLQITRLSEQLVLLNESTREFYTMTKQLEQEHLLDGGGWSALKQAFSHEASVLRSLRKQNEEFISKITLLTKLSEHVLKYIKVIKSTDELQKIKLKIETHAEIKEALLTDLRSINKHLESQVNHYFHVDLINTIYRKIDPHPNFKKIDFRCSFPEDGKPKLQVYITDDAGNNIVSPTLSFSSAQVNVLSLSIFLAKALNTKNAVGAVDCIFIDDPVQSMDSINVLGVIDLLRSLSVNLGKQIIISTHDDNFHSLLKQKIPKSLFKSKFLELESFGKVASHLGQ